MAEEHRRTMTDSVRVLIVDDQPPFRDAAQSVIGRLDGFDVVAECELGRGRDRMVRSTVTPTWC